MSHMFALWPVCCKACKTLFVEHVNYLLGKIKWLGIAGWVNLFLCCACNMFCMRPIHTYENIVYAPNLYIHPDISVILMMKRRVI